MRSFPWKLAAGGSLLVATACGPSFQAIYEGDQKFEHCYALDDNPNVALQDKGTCWRDWMKGYTYGQTRDRVEYAAVRQRALARVALPTDEAMMEAAPGQVVSKSSVAAPAPTSAFAPPPKTLSDGNPGASRPAHVPSSPAPQPSVVFVAPREAAPPAKDTPPPAADCQEQCSSGWASCRGKGDESAEAACTKTYRTCMRACFK